MSPVVVCATVHDILTFSGHIPENEDDFLQLMLAVQIITITIYIPMLFKYFYPFMYLYFNPIIAHL
jgi:hypothetical protein